MFSAITKKLKAKFYPVKANVNSRGEKIYHIPEGRLYYTVQPVEYFKTEAAAKKAGYRKSKI